MNPDPASLDRLHDLITPPPVPWWPPAPGWYGVLGLLLAGVIVLFLRWLLCWQHNRSRREALAELARQESLLRHPATRPAGFAAVAVLLKRAAVTAFPRTDVARLTGPAWFEFLARTDGSGAFTPGLGAAFERAVFDSHAAAAWDDAKTEEVVVSAREWLAHHHPEAPGKESRC